VRLRVIFKDREEQIYNNAVINKDERLVEFSNDKGETVGYVPFEAVFVIIKEK